MSKFIELTRVDLRTEGDVDDLEQPVAPATSPITIDASNIREFYPRRGGKPGTRIVYHNSAAQIVAEDYAAVKAVLASLNN